MTTTATTTGLQTKAMTVNLSINQWTARKHDKKITKEVEDNHNAKDAGRYNKLLIAKKELENIQKAANAARTFHYENTLPWGDNGDRLLPSTNYFTYTAEMVRLKNQFEAAVNEFVNNYEAVIDDAKIRLNGLFDPTDYPNPGQIRSKFGFNTCFMPLPETDFRLDINQTEINALTLALENEIKNRINNAVRDAWQRIKDQLTKMKDRLTSTDEKGNPVIFRNSLFDNLADLIELIPKLNVTEDEKLNQICEEMKTLLTVDPETVRTNSSVREDKANEVERLLSKFDNFFN